MTNSHDQSSESIAAASEVDVLSNMLRSVRLTGSMLFLVEASTPWVSWAPQTETFQRLVLPAAQHLISFHIVTHGSCWAGLAGAPPERFEVGDVLVIPHGDAYYLADPPAAERTYGFEEALTFFRRMAAGKLPSTIFEGGDGPGTTQVICGFLGCDLRPFNPVLSALPRLLRVRPVTPTGDGLPHPVAFAMQELRERRSGGQAVKLRMAELLFVDVIRRHLETLPGEKVGWLAGLRNPLVARAGIAARCTGPELDARCPRGAGGYIALRVGRTLCAFHRSTADAVSEATAHAVGESIACRGRCQGCLRRSGRRLRIRSCVQSRFQEVRWVFPERMAPTTGRVRDGAVPITANLK